MVTVNEKVLTARDLKVGVPVQMLTRGRYPSSVEPLMVGEMAVATAPLMYGGYVIGPGGVKKHVPADATFRVLKGAAGRDLLRVEASNILKGIVEGIATGSGANVGSDPEIFVLDGNGVLLPAFTFLKAKKESPDVYWDGFQAEFTVVPGGCFSSVMDSIQERLAKLLKLARGHDKGARLNWKPLQVVPPSLMESASDEHAALGCAPSQNIYGIPPLEVPSGRALPYRFAGCHMHFAWPQLHANRAMRFTAVKAMDAIFGTLACSLLAGMDDPMRRNWYGRAGEHRLPSHGIEYRVPSSAILAHPVITNLAFDVARWAGRVGMAGVATKVWPAMSKEQVLDIVNNGNIDEARRVLRTNKAAVMAMIAAIYKLGAPYWRTYPVSRAKKDTSTYTEGTSIGFQGLPDGKEKGLEGLRRHIFDMVMGGASQHLDVRPEAMEANWHLSDKEWVPHDEAPNCCVNRLEPTAGWLADAKAAESVELIEKAKVKMLVTA